MKLPIRVLAILLISMSFGLAPAAAQTAGADAATDQQDTRSDAERVRDAIQNDPLAPTVAPENHDVTIVMYSDYQCPYCRKMQPVLEALMEKDEKVRLVYRDWPIFGEVSERAARAAIAAQFQGKHEAFHGALMRSNGKLSFGKIRDAADEAGIDWDQLKSDMVTHKDEIDALLERSRIQATLLGFSGTPGLMVGPLRFGGALDLQYLETAVEQARKVDNKKQSDE